MRSCDKRYLCVAAISMIGVGVGMAVALKTRAIPKLLTRAKTEMMRRMMAQMGEGCCGPAMSGCASQHGREESDEQQEPAATTSSRCGCGATPTAEEATEAEVV